MPLTNLVHNPWILMAPTEHGLRCDGRPCHMTFMPFSEREPASPTPVSLARDRLCPKPHQAAAHTPPAAEPCPTEKVRGPDTLCLSCHHHLNTPIGSDNISRVVLKMGT